MSADDAPKFQVQRRARVDTDGRGRSVRSEPVEPVELELVSTLALKRILDNDDGSRRKSIEKVAHDSAEGVLAMDPASGRFSVIDDKDLQAILDENRELPPVSRPSEVTLVPLDAAKEAAAGELSLVSTQALRKMLGKPEVEEPPPEKVKLGGGFDPYNSG